MAKFYVEVHWLATEKVEVEAKTAKEALAKWEQKDMDINDMDFEQGGVEVWTTDEDGCPDECVIGEDNSDEEEE